jgi:hypothetical protein
VIVVSLDAVDLNAVLPAWLPQDTSVVYSAGLFSFSYRLPIGAASGVAIGSFRGSEVVFSVPFRRISVSLLGPLAGALTKTFWGSITGPLAKVLATKLRSRGLPPDTIAVGQGRDEGGETVGLITVRLDRVHAWLDERSAVLPIAVRVEGVTFQPDMIDVAVDLLPLSQ